MPAFRSVVSVLVSFAVRTFSTNSRPALRAAACGGRPRPAGSMRALQQAPAEHNFLYARCCHVWQLVLPNAYDAPCCFFQPLISVSIPSTIGHDLRTPIPVVHSWLMTVFRATMPEAPINEDCHSLSHEGDIDLPSGLRKKPNMYAIPKPEPVQSGAE
jgi:hypothetical protein